MYIETSAAISIWLGYFVHTSNIKHSFLVSIWAHFFFSSYSVIDTQTIYINIDYDVNCVCTVRTSHFISQCTHNFTYVFLFIISFYTLNVERRKCSTLFHHFTIYFHFKQIECECTRCRKTEMKLVQEQSVQRKGESERELNDSFLFFVVSTKGSSFFILHWFFILFIASFHQILELFFFENHYNKIIN